MRTLYIFTVLIIWSIILNAQTITPIYFINDSIDISKVKFINPKNDKTLKVKFENKLIDIVESYPDTVRIIIPFKNGVEIILDSVPTRFIDIACVIDAHVNTSADKHCCSIAYQWGDLIRTRNSGSNCSNLRNIIEISTLESYYDNFTKNLGIKVFDKMSSKEYFERMQERNN